MACLRWLVGLAACLFASLPAAADMQPRDVDVKAEVVFNLLLFVEWPMPAAAWSPRLCVVAEGGLLHALTRQAGKHLRGRPLMVDAIDPASKQLDTCAAVMVEAGRTGVIERLGLAAQKRPLLVIAEGENAVARGAMISLIDNHGRIAFDINLYALKRSGLAVSSKLLRLARVLEEGGHD